MHITNIHVLKCTMPILYTTTILYLYHTTYLLYRVMNLWRSFGAIGKFVL